MYDQNHTYHPLIPSRKA